MALSYDRRAPDDLLDALLPGGFAHSMVDYARSRQYSMDLQLRGYASTKKQQEHWATLYVGLTKVLDLHFHPTRGFRLGADKAYREPARAGWQAAWEKWQPEDRMAPCWGAVEEYLESVIPGIAPRFFKEGAVQSAISGFASRDMVVIDREAAVAFGDETEKRQVCGELERDLLHALGPGGPGAWWKTRPDSLGGECDALAVDAHGHLLAIEIKPARATGTIAWAPLQVRHYANLFARWAEDAEKDGGSPAEVIQGMIDQRARLGLIAHRPQVSDPLVVRPVVAVGRGASEEAIRRLGEVHRRLDDAGKNDPPLEVRWVNIPGRLDPLPL